LLDGSSDPALDIWVVRSCRNSSPYPTDALGGAIHGVSAAPGCGGCRHRHGVRRHWSLTLQPVFSNLTINYVARRPRRRNPVY
jgi:hypothetical protein